jgi:hypothetical protein
MNLIKVELEQQVVDFIRSLPLSLAERSGEESRTLPARRETSGRLRENLKVFTGYASSGIGSYFSIRFEAMAG